MTKISIKLGPTERRKNFKSKEELSTFIEEEKQYWANIYSDWINPSPLNRILTIARSNLVTHFAHLERLIAGIQADYSNIEGIVSQIEQYYEKYKVLYSTSAYAKWAESIENKDLAIFILCARVENGFQNVVYDNAGNFPPHTRQHANKVMQLFYQSSLEKAMYENGYIENIAPERQALSALKEEWDNTIDEARSDLETNNNEYSNLKTNSEQCKENTQRQFDINKKKFSSFMSRSKKEMEAFEDFYEKKLAMDSAVVYWRNKKENSYKWSIGLALVILVIGYISISVLLGISETIGHNLLDTNTTKGIVAQIKFLPILHFAVISTFVIWGLRILVKVFLSKLHIADSAAEREMFIKSYLALLNEHAEGVKDDMDRQLILQSIFRPSSDGLINDDGPKITDLINVINRQSK